MAVNATAVSAQPLGAKPTLHTPDVIAPAVLPYLACLYAERGLPLLSASDGTQIPFDRTGANCSGARARATADAAKLMRDKTAPAGVSADVFVEQTLDDMDNYVASMPVTKNAAKAEQVIGIPVTIEDEVQPAYARYDDCLKTQVSGSEVTADTVVAKFQQAMGVCRSVRDFAVHEAEQALSAKGWDEARRTSAAETTFEKADESWLAMARQYQQALLKSVNAGRR